MMNTYNVCNKQKRAISLFYRSALICKQNYFYDEWMNEWMNECKWRNKVDLSGSANLMSFIKQIIMYKLKQTVV